MRSARSGGRRVRPCGLRQSRRSRRKGLRRGNCRGIHIPATAAEDVPRGQHRTAVRAQRGTGGTKVFVGGGPRIMSRTRRCRRRRRSWRVFRSAPRDDAVRLIVSEQRCPDRGRRSRRYRRAEPCGRRRHGREGIRCGIRHRRHRGYRRRTDHTRRRRCDERRTACTAKGVMTSHTRATDWTLHV